jgi:hypothetical protein
MTRTRSLGSEELSCLDAGNEASFSFSTEDAGDYLPVLENQYPFPGALGYDIVRNCYLPTPFPPQWPTSHGAHMNGPGMSEGTNVGAMALAAGQAMPACVHAFRV